MRKIKTLLLKSTKIKIESFSSKKGGYGNLKTGYSKNWQKLNSQKVSEYRQKSFEKLKSNPEKYEKRLKSQSKRNKIRYANNPEIYKEKSKAILFIKQRKTLIKKIGNGQAKKHPEKVLEIKRKYSQK